MEEQKITLNEVIDSAVSKLGELDPSTDEYTTAANNLQTVTDVKKAIEEKPRRGPSPDAVLGTLATCGLAGLFFFAEKRGIYLGSKPTSWLPKPKIWK